MNCQVLYGRIDITDNVEIVRTIINSLDNSAVIINLDEDSRIDGNNVIQGSVLLPPPEAIMAEQDGDQFAYDAIMDDYYNIKDIQLFVTGIINMLYRGVNVLIYYPDLDPKESITVPKLINLYWNKFGLGIGVLGVSDCYYNNNSIPMWLNMLYDANAIGPYEYLCKYPLDAKLLDNYISKLINDIRPADKDKSKGIFRLHKRLHDKPNTTEALIKL